MDTIKTEIRNIKLVWAQILPKFRFLQTLFLIGIFFCLLGVYSMNTNVWFVLFIILGVIIMFYTIYEKKRLDKSIKTFSHLIDKLETAEVIK
jgi:Flp pilus assembly protein TadB